MLWSLIVAETEAALKRRAEGAEFAAAAAAAAAAATTAAAATADAIAAGALFMDTGGVHHQAPTPPSTPVRMRAAASRCSPRVTTDLAAVAAARREADIAASKVRRSWQQTNYDHKLYCHAWELLLRYGSIGAFSSQFLEAGNKWWKRWATTSRAARTKQLASLKAMNKMVTTTSIGATGRVKKRGKSKKRSKS